MKSRLAASMRSVLATAAAGLLASTGCSTAASDSSDGGVRGKRQTACVTTLFPTGTFSEFVNALKNAGGKDWSFDVQDVSNNSSKESQVLSACAIRKVDVIFASVVSPNGSIAALQRLKSSGIPVICYNTCLNPPQDQRLTHAFITNDQAKLGETTATAASRYIKKKLGGNAKIGYLTCETYDVCKQRRKGLEKGLSGVNAQLVASQEGFVVDKATPVATAMLAARPDINVLIAENEDGVIAAANAVRARGLTGRTVVFGIGMNPTVGKLLLAADGTVQESTGQDAAAWATEVLKVAAAARSGGNATPYYRFTPGPVFEHGNPEPIKQYLAQHPQ